MLNNTLNFLLIFFSILLAFGELDPIFPMSSPIGSIDLVFIIFTLLFVINRPKDFLRAIFSFNFFALLTILFLFILAQSIYGYNFLVKPLINFKYILSILFFVIVSVFFKRNTRWIHYCLLAFSISCFAYTILVLCISPNLYQIYKGQLIVLEENPNSTSSRLVMGIIYLIYSFIRNPLNLKRWFRFSLLLMLPTLIAMVVLSGSRGSLLALIIGVYLIFIFSDMKRITKILLTFSSVIISFILFQFLLSSEDLSVRWEGALEGDTAGRTEIWDAVLDIVGKHPFGIGENGYMEAIPKYIGKYLDTHNIFLYVLVCGGWLSLIIFIIFLLRIMLNSLRAYFLSKDLLALLLFLVIIFIASKTGGAITYLLFWFVLAVANSYKAIQYER